MQSQTRRVDLDKKLLHSIAPVDLWFTNLVGHSTENCTKKALMDRDYYAPGFEIEDLSPAFPHRVVGDKSTHPWVFLRKDVPHKWYVDERDPLMGFLSTDEAAILAHMASAIPDAEALEIGSHRGWSTAHIAGNVKFLDVVDPIFSNEEHKADVIASLESAGVVDNCSLVAGKSPQTIEELAAKRNGKPWSFIFVDGDHEGNAASLDAMTVSKHAARDAVVVFHDLSSPDVANGLATMRSLGWKTMVFQTMQIMGVAWRGEVSLPEHVPDPDVAWTLPNHLHSFYISGEDLADRASRMDNVFAQLTSYDQHARDLTSLLPGITIFEERHAQNAFSTNVPLSDQKIPDIENLIAAAQEKIVEMDTKIELLSNELEQQKMKVSHLQNKGLKALLKK